MAQEPTLWYSAQLDRMQQSQNQEPIHASQRAWPQDRVSFSGWCWILCFAIICSPQAAQSQWSDAFEGGEPRWRLVESDCQAQLVEHEISQLMPHGGRTSELFQVACGHGTFVLLAYPIEPCTIIEEFRPSLWTRCSSGRIRFGVRVVFPFAAHPLTGGRLTTVLWGDTYTEPGHWQNLEASKLEERLAEETIAIRQEFGAKIRLEGAYVDSLVLNAYTGPGRYRVQTDDMALRGIVPMSSIGFPPPEDWRQRWRWRHESTSQDVRYWSAPNSPPLWLQYRNEPLPWVESLGFTGIVTDALPSRKQLADAKQANLGIICPPPAYAVEFPSETLPALKGWLIGAALDSRQSAVAEEQSRRVASLPLELHKPLVAEALEDYFRYSRLADEVIVPQQVATSAGTASAKARWLSEQLSTTKQRGDGWVSINIGVPPTLAGQLESALSLLEPDEDIAALTVDPLGFRHQVVGAVISGARGFLFRTFRPLDVRNSADSAQVAALRWVRNDLSLWGPWVVSGQPIPPPTLSAPEWIAAAWSISDSRLIVAQTAAEGSQYCVPPSANSPLEVGFPVLGSGQQVFRLSGGRLERVSADSSPAGLQWTVAEPKPVESFLVTSNPVVIRFARTHLERNAATNAADQLEVTTHNLSLASQQIAAQFPNTQFTARLAAPAARAAEQLAVAQRQLDSGMRALQTQQAVAAIGLSSQASESIQALLFDAHVSARQSLATPQSSPLAVTPAAFRLHWRLAEACARSEWKRLEFPGSEFANLSTMLQSGWSQQRRLEEVVDLRVELVPATEQSSSGLRLAAYARQVDQPVDGGYAGASLRVRSAGVPVRAGQLVRISAVARVLQASDQPGSGLLVYDNQVGPSLGQLVSGKVGEQIPVELFRFVVTDGQFRLLAECRGECDIILESVEASFIQPATNRREYFTAPVGTLPSAEMIEISPNN